MIIQINNNKKRNSKRKLEVTKDENGYKFISIKR